MVISRVAADLLTILNYAYPSLVLLVFLVASLAHSINLSKRGNREKKESTTAAATPSDGPSTNRRGRKRKNEKKALPKVTPDFSSEQKRVFLGCNIAVVLTYLANASLVILRAWVDRDAAWWCDKQFVCYIVGSFFVFIMLFFSSLDSIPSPTFAHAITWTFAASFEITTVALSAAIYSSNPLGLYTWLSNGEKHVNHINDWEFAEILTNCVRIFFLLAYLITYSIWSIPPYSKIQRETSPPSLSNVAEETIGLLTEEQRQMRTSQSKTTVFGTVEGDGEPLANAPHAPAAWEKPISTPDIDWLEYLLSYSVFFSYLWPSNNRALQLRVLLGVFVMILQRIVTILLPRQIGIVFNDVVQTVGYPSTLCDICLWAFYYYLHTLVLNNLRNFFWTPVKQYSFSALSVACCQHVLRLSFKFHKNTKPGALQSVMKKGNAVNNFLEIVTFQIVPMGVDLVNALIIFSTVLDAYHALVLGIVLLLYFGATMRMAKSRAELRREMSNAENESEAVLNESIVSYTTIQYFDAVDFEVNRYRSAVGLFQRLDYLYSLSVYIMNIVQQSIFTAGLFVSIVIAAWQIYDGQAEVGLIAQLLSYWALLREPLNVFAQTYKQIQTSMVNSERMLELFKEKPEVVDAADVSHLDSCVGDVEFDGVCFNHDVRKPAIRGLAFRCIPGTTTALVGESGAGKSTILNLLYRFYNPSSGRILIDGHDITDISINSLRRHIGVVPQDPILHNETLLYNLRYAKPSAPDEEIYAACRAACLHEQILAFPDGYSTKVGEQGRGLSGGERQRVAIACAILKNASIILLDEATASLDTNTEQSIRQELETLSEGRTVLVIAHRLSTITHAEQILVIGEGRVVERGTHAELLDVDGKYAEMWRKQSGTAV